MADEPKTHMMGGGFLREAARKLRGRKMQLDEEEAAQTGSAPSPAGGVEFQKPFTSDEKVSQQQKLAEILRRRRAQSTEGTR